MTTRKEKNLAQALNQQREARIAKLLEAGRIRSAKEIPEDALPAALELQNPQGTWSPPLYYRDISFHCKDCRKHEMWSATQQRWYYEIAKGSLLSQATRCRACRKKHREETLRQRELLRLHREKKAAESKEPGKR
ncbi:MAG: zinc-ribbon domain containing protein [Verrucomicrobia bacterium]|nr:zinc-ribbon domain containing protein [Verrucomicrobiota bacterium]